MIGKDKEKDREVAADGQVEAADRKGEFLGEQSGTNAPEASGKAESVGSLKEAMRDDASREGGDFFAGNERRLGFKGKLSLAIRHSLARLERSVCEEAGVTSGGLRREFLSLTVASGAGSFAELGVPIERVIRDYRTFLILRIASEKRRKRRG